MNAAQKEAPDLRVGAQFRITYLDKTGQQQYLLVQTSNDRLNIDHKRAKEAAEFMMAMMRCQLLSIQCMVQHATPVDVQVEERPSAKVTPLRLVRTGLFLVWLGITSTLVPDGPGLMRTAPAAVSAEEDAKHYSTGLAHA